MYIVYGIKKSQSHCLVFSVYSPKNNDDLHNIYVYIENDDTITDYWRILHNNRVIFLDHANI